MTKLTFTTAPYNFVPHAEQVVFPSQDEIAQASQDAPLANGLSGHLELELHAADYLLVGGEQSPAADGIKQVNFFQTPDGQYAIPGSSLRGMISNVLKIAMFGKLKQVDDKRLAMRDLSPAAKEQYQSQFTESLHAKGQRPQYRSKVKAGWLRFDGQVWQLQETEVARVESLPFFGPNLNGNTLMEYAETLVRDDHVKLGKTWKELFDVNWQNEAGEQGVAAAKAAKLKRKPLKKIYECWGQICSSTKTAFPLIPVKFSVGPAQFHAHSGKDLHYRKVSSLGKGEQDGILVLTGHPGSQKHMEFVFFDRPMNDRVHILTEPEFQNFKFAYQDSEAWQFWMEKYKTGKISRLPVFFLSAEEGQTTGLRLGFTQLFKLPMKLSLHEAINNTSPDHTQQKPDYVELIFGRLDEPDQRPEQIGWQRKGRVDFSLALLHSELQREDVQIHPYTIQPGGPKPTFFPNYVRQGVMRLAAKEVKPDNPFQKLAVLKKGLFFSRFKAKAGKDGKEVMHTLLEERAQLRGWKRYQVKGFDQQDIDERLNKFEAQCKKEEAACKNANELQKLKLKLQERREKQQLRLHFLHAPNKELRFQLHLRFHNLQPFELGALLWALSWGKLNDNTHFHSLGMGKPYGAGAVRFVVQKLHYRANAAVAAGFQLEEGAQLSQPNSQTQACLAAFKKTMSDKVPGWEGTRQIKNLLQMASKWQGEAKDWRYMKLGIKPDLNEFAEAKNDRLRLREREEYKER